MYRVLLLDGGAEGCVLGLIPSPNSVGSTTLVFLQNSMITLLLIERPRMTRWLLSGLFWWVLVLPLAAEVPDMPEATDLAQTRQELSEEVLVLYFTANHCMYCQALDRQVLAPALRSGVYEGRARFLRVQHDEPQTQLRDFDGNSVTNRDLIQRYEVRVTPTLVFVDSQGHEVAPALVGLLTVDFYTAYLEQNLDIAQTMITPLAN